VVFGVLIIFVGYERREVSVVSMLVLAANDVECCVVYVCSVFRSSFVLHQMQSAHMRRCTCRRKAH